MDIRKAKREAAAAGLELWYCREWQSWGLTSPALDVESEWISPGALKSLTPLEFGRYISAMHAKIHPDAGGEFPIADELPTLKLGEA